MPRNPILKTIKIQVRLTPLEKEQLEALAAKSQMNISEYIRSTIRRETAKLK